MNKVIKIIIIITVLIAVSLIYVISINAASTFYNPRDTSNQRPDPYVYKHTDGYYYGVCTIQDHTGYVPRLDMWKSKSLVNLYTTGSRKTIWNAPSSGWNTANIWAPELHRINCVWYIYYSANCRFGVLSNSNADPTTGSWIDHGMLSPDVWAIDPTILNQNGSMYVLWSGQNNGQVLNITRMSSPTSLTGSSVQISSPTYSWETQGLKVNEGPEIIQNSGTTYCIYSASHCANQYYCLGQLSIPSNANPMVTGNWTKKSSPVFQRSPSEGIYGTGHASFTKSKDGTEDWIVYHATITPSSLYQPRYVCMQKYSFNPDGSPNFGSPLGKTSPLNYPSGEGDTNTNTSSGIVQEGVEYNLINRHSGKLLEVQNASTSDGANIVQWPSNGHACQRWTFESIGSGYYKIKNVNSGKYLEVMSALTNDGADISQWDNTGHACQEWSLQSIDNSYYVLVNRNSGKAADVFEWSTADGAEILQWTNFTGANQQWSIIPN